MKKCFLLNERIRLRAMEPEDLEVMYQIENNPELWEVSSFTVPYSRYALKEYIAHSQNDLYADKQLRLMIVRQTDHSVIGTIDLTDYVPLHGRGAVGIAILKEHRRQGYAAEALQLLCEYAFEFLNLRQLYAHIPADNTPSLELFTSCGFTESGLLIDWLRSENSYKDAVLVQYINR